MIQKKLVGMMLITFLVLLPQVLVGQERGAIRPLIYGEYEKVQLLPTRIWLIEGKPLSDMERELLQVSYLRGLYDGLQLANVGWPSIYTVLNELAGMDLAQLREEINKLYSEYAEMGNNPPAIMVLEVIPGMRKRIPPADPREEKGKKEEVK
ncbi:MAG: hypothetical protein ACXU93_08880 [Thermodesulfobacteriota bacterium]